MKYSVGVDIGGSHISCALVDLDTIEIIRGSLTVLPVDNKGTAREIVKTWSAAIRKSMQHMDSSQLTGIGFAMPGPFDYVNGISLIRGVDKYENLYGLDVGEEIVKSLGMKSGQPVRFINDAAAFAIGEARAGKAAGTDRSMVITLGTGFGSAFIKQGVPVVSGESVPEKGWVYHLKYRDSIADDYFSTRWFLRRFKELTGTDADGVKYIADEALKNEQIREIFHEFGASLGRFLAPILNKFGAEVLVMGGNISRAIDLFGPSLRLELENNDCPATPHVSLLGENAALMGSACLLDAELWHAVKGTL